MSRAEDVERAHATAWDDAQAERGIGEIVADLIAAIRAETFEACAAHLTMRAEQSLPDLIGRVSADVLRAAVSEIRMLAREAAK